MLSIWEEGASSEGGWNTLHVAFEAQHALRCVRALPACAEAGLPEGGWAAGSLDKMIRIYNAKGEVVRTLSGHTGGVIHLAVAAAAGPSGKPALLSGSWDGTARVWDLTDGKCLACLDGHENGVCVTALDDQGSVLVTGSTGVKNELDMHVDYKVRHWARTSPSETHWACSATITDHDQAVRGLARVPVGAAAYASASNDGTVKLRAADGSVISSWMSPVLNPQEGVPAFVFGVDWLPGVPGTPAGAAGLLAAYAEDLKVRLYAVAADGNGGPQVAELAHSGTPWAADVLPNGDLVTACSQIATSRRGHVYQWSIDPARVANDMQQAKFKQDCTPPSSNSTGGADGLQILGDYDSKGTVSGHTDGQYGFFKTSDGKIMACMWSKSAGIWMDVGCVTDGAEAGSSSGGGGEDAGSDAGYDYVRHVELDVPTGGTQALKLRWNACDDPMTIAQQFCSTHSLHGSYEQVRDFILQQMPAGGAAASGARAGGKVASYATLPVKLLTYAAFKPDQAFSKIQVNNAVLQGDESEGESSGITMAVTDEARFKTLQEVAAGTSFYHVSQLGPLSVTLVTEKLLRWPQHLVAPVYDVVGALMRHHSAGAAILQQLPLLPLTWAQVVASTDAPSGLRVLSARALANACATKSCRAQVLAGVEDVLAALEPALCARELPAGLAGKAVLAAASALSNLARGIHDDGVCTAEQAEAIMHCAGQIIQQTGESQLADLAAQTVGTLAIGASDVAKAAVAAADVTSCGAASAGITADVMSAVRAI